MKRRTLQLLLLATLSSSAAMGQINCAPNSAASTKLVCEFPWATGLYTDNAFLNSGGSGTAPTLGAVDAAAKAAVFNTAIATQVSQLPLASASAGTVVIYKAGVPETFDDLGPILTDRAQTVGKHKLFLGFTASQFVFTDIDGISLKALPFSYEQQYISNGIVESTTYTTEDMNLKFKVNQFVGVATFGLSNRVDISAVVPWERMSLGASTVNSKSYLLPSVGELTGPDPNPQVYTPGTANGVGDVIVNAKVEIWRGERATFAAAMNVRTPTGDKLNFLGSGAWGFSPYLVYSYLGKVSPHVRIGYQWNTTTELNNPTAAAGGNQTLPGGIQYDAGADWAVRRHVTIAGDLLGNQYLNAPIVLVGTAQIPNTSITMPTSNNGSSSYSINNLSAGLKWNPTRGLVFSGNVLFQLNNSGLRSRPTPLLGLSYKF